MPDLLKPQNWTRWYSQRPPDPEPGKPRVLYWWRAGPRKILGLEMNPEWTDELHCCGMGYSSNEWWPGFSRWDGWNRTLPKETEWAVACLEPTAQQKGRAATVVWPELEATLLPCPWSGKPPRVDYSGQWIGAPPYNSENLILRTRWGTTHWRDAAKMRDAWNARFVPESEDA